MTILSPAGILGPTLVAQSIATAFGKGLATDTLAMIVATPTN